MCFDSLKELVVTQEIDISLFVVYNTYSLIPRTKVWHFKIRKHLPNETENISSKALKIIGPSSI